MSVIRHPRTYRFQIRFGLLLVQLLALFFSTHGILLIKVKVFVDFAFKHLYFVVYDVSLHGFIKGPIWFETFNVHRTQIQWTL